MEDTEWIELAEDNSNGKFCEHIRVPNIYMAGHGSRSEAVTVGSNPTQGMDGYCL
jgi:hypothetical protein